MNKTITIFLLFIFLIPSISLATSGCCSHHGGVCGCDSSVGKQACCDGTNSPSCTCAYNPPPVKTTPTISKLATLEETNNNSWCGAGIFFETKNEADNSLKKYRSEIEDPLNKKIENLTQEKNDFENKILVNFIFLLFIYSLSIITMFAICETCSNKTLIAFIKIALILFFIYLILGGFSYLHP
jgi:hypothetical protein